MRERLSWVVCLFFLLFRGVLVFSSSMKKKGYDVGQVRCGAFHSPFKTKKTFLQKTIINSRFALERLWPQSSGYWTLSCPEMGASITIPYHFSRYYVSNNFPAYFYEIKFPYSLLKKKKFSQIMNNGNGEKRRKLYEVFLVTDSNKHDTLYNLSLVTYFSKTPTVNIIKYTNTPLGKKKKGKKSDEIEVTLFKNSKKENEVNISKEEFQSLTFVKDDGQKTKNSLTVNKVWCEEKRNSPHSHKCNQCCCWDFEMQNHECNELCVSDKMRRCPLFYRPKVVTYEKKFLKYVKG